MQKKAFVNGVRFALPAVFTILICSFSFAQITEEADTTESAGALDDFTTGRHIIAERQVLKHAPIREADVLWEKRIWRVIDTREKMNHSFVSPESPLFSILSEAVQEGKLNAYSTIDDKFSTRLDQEEIVNILHEIDTVTVMDFDTGEETVQVVRSDINWEDVKRFRIKEVWWFDKNLGTLRQRVLGIAPLFEVKNADGDFLFERPLFWIHYPSARNLLAQHQAMTSGENLSAATTWEDMIEMRRFSSYIVKESNLQDRRLQDYMAGTDLLQEGGKINDELFNREHDLWSY